MQNTYLYKKGETDNQYDFRICCVLSQHLNGKPASREILRDNSQTIVSSVSVHYQTLYLTG